MHTLNKLVQSFASNPTWGFASTTGSVEIRTSDEFSRLLRLGATDMSGDSAATLGTLFGALPPTRAQAQAAASDDLIVYRAIVQPGQSVAALLTSAARRLNRLIGVSADGILQVWNPDYTQRARYRIDYHEADDPDSVRNNVISCQIGDKLDGKYSRVEVVGQVVGWYAQDTNDLAPGRFSGVATNSDAVPFDHELTYSEAEIWDPDLAPYAAQWKLNRGLYDSFAATYKLRGHHQNGAWWAAGTMCELHDSVNGYDGPFFVSAIKHMRTGDGDQTEVTLRLPGLLAASFDRLRALN